MALDKYSDEEIYKMFRVLLPDEYTKAHPKIKQEYDQSPPKTEGPLNPGAKRKGYKKVRKPVAKPVQNKIHVRNLPKKICYL